MARGMPEKQAIALGKRMIANPEVGLDTLAREELGLNPDELGSPWVAACSNQSILFFNLLFAAIKTPPIKPMLIIIGKCNSNPTDNTQSPMPTAANR